VRKAIARQHLADAGDGFAIAMKVAEHHLLQVMN
jgi:hypothetical protein